MSPRIDSVLSSNNNVHDDKPTMWMASPVSHSSTWNRNGDFVTVENQRINIILQKLFWSPQNFKLSVQYTGNVSRTDEQGRELMAKSII